MSSRVVAAFSLLGLRKAGTPLLIASTPVRAAQPEEKARSSRNAAAMPVSSSPLCGQQREAGALGRRQGAGELLDEADDAHADDAEHEEVDRHGEGLARLAHAAEVHRGEEDDDDDADDDLVAPHEPEDGAGVLHAGADRDGHGQHVVDEQRARDGEPGLGPEVDRGHLVVAAARGVGAHVLPVGRHDDDHDEDDGDGDLPAVRHREGAAGEPEHEHDLVGRVRHGREGVAREDRQGESLGQQRLAQLVAAHRATEEKSLEQRSRTWHGRHCMPERRLPQTIPGGRPRGGHHHVWTRDGGPPHGVASRPCTS